MFRLCAILGALLLAFWGQGALTRSQAQTPGDALLLFGLAALLFVWGAQRPLPLRLVASGPPPGWNRRGRLLALAGLAVGVASLLLLWFDLHSLPGLLLWPAATILFLAGAFAEDCPPAAENSPPARRQPPWDLLLLALILVLAAAVRFYQLDVHPNGCQSDECNNGIDALRWLSGAPYTPYAETNDGQATFFTYLIALSFRLFGAGVPQMRLVAAAIGVLTVAAFYPLSRDLYGRGPALFATALLAASRWHLTFSRIVYELIMQPLFMILVCFFLLRALRGGRRRDWALAGLMLTAGMNTYTGFRIVPVIVAVFLLFWLGRSVLRLWRQGRRGTAAPGVSWRSLRQDVAGMAVMAGSTLLSILPLGVYIVQNWGIFTHRIVKIGVMGEVAQARSWDPIWQNLLKTLFMFNWQGDGGSLNNLPGAPMLDTLPALLFVLGLAYTVFYALHARSLPVLYVLWFGAILSLGVFSAAHEAPSARRTIGMIPLLYLMAALVADQLWLRWRQAMAGAPSRWPRRIAATAASAAVLLAAWGNVQTYFSVQALHPQVWQAYSPIESSIGRYLNTLPAGATILISPRYEHHSAVKLYAQGHPYRAWNPLEDFPFRSAGDATPAAEDAGQELVYILEAGDKPLLQLLETMLPGGVAQGHYDRYGMPLFLSFAAGVTEVQSMHGLAGSFFDSPLPVSAWPGAPAGTPADASASGFSSPLPTPASPALPAPIVATSDASFGSPLPSPLPLPALAGSTSSGASTAEGAPAINAAPINAAPIVTETALALDWQLAEAALPPPFGARWQGTLLLDDFGEYVFTLRSQGASAALQIGQQPPLRVEGNGQAVMTATLPAGFHPIELTYASGAEPGRLQVLWSGPQFEQRVLDAGALYTFDLGRDGLIGYSYPNDQWQEPPTWASVDVYVSANSVLPVPYSIRWLGKIAIPETGDYLFGTRSDDGSYVYIDDQLVVDNGGQHGAQEQQGVIRLAAGWHDLDLRYSESGGSQEMEFWWQPPGRERAAVESRYLLPVIGEATPAGYAPPPLESIVRAEAPGASATLPDARVTAFGVTPQLPGAARVVADGFDQPRAIAVAPDGRVYVAENGGGRVQVLDAAGRRLGQIPAGGDALAHPVDLVAGTKGVVVLDESGRLARFAADGRLLAELNGAGVPLGRSRGLGTDAQGRLWVANTAGGFVQLFEADGVLAAVQPIQPDGGQPSDVLVGKDGRIFVADPVRGLLLRYSAGGEPEQAWSIAPANTLDSPHLALAPDGKLYLTDPERGRVYQLNAEGQPLGMWDLSAQLERPVKPVGIAVGLDGRVWVADVTGGAAIVIEMD